MEHARYFEDFSIGQQFRSTRSYTIEKENAIAFAREFDPQLHHVDEEDAKDSQFGELVVSGWHTAAASMRLKSETELFQIKGGVAGLGLDHVRWPRPTRPGDSIRILITILSMRPSNSKPDKGIINYKVETFNQRDELVMEMTTAVIVPRRMP
jgi:acyl dehydratase